MIKTEYNAEKKLWCGQNSNSDCHLNQSLGQIIFKSLQLYGPKVSQICANTCVTRTFAELRESAINTAKNLQHFGCEKGDVIFFLTRNTADIAPLVFAALYLAAPIFAISEFSSRMECEVFLKLLRPKFIFCDKDFYQKSKECSLNTNIEAMIFIFDGSSVESTSVSTLFNSPGADVYLEPVNINAVTDTAFIVETSGTTGKRKCIRISHATIIDRMTNLKCIFKPTDVVLGYTVLNGVSGIRSLLGPILNGSTRIVNHDPFSSKRYCEIVEKFKVTVSICSGAFVGQLRNHLKTSSADLSSLKLFCAGGTKVFYDVIQNMSKYLTGGKFCHSYGMTETCGAIAINLSHTLNDCVGQLISGIEAKIVDERGERLGIGEIGELCLKFACPILGYLGGDQSANNIFDSEGFFLTGDLARFDEYNDLFIVDRIKEVFKCFKFPVSPNEIEEYLNNIDGVKQSCVLPIPALGFDCLPAAIIVKTVDSKCTKQSIYSLVQKDFSHFKHLRGGVYFVDELPVNSGGKVDRICLKKMVIELSRNRKS